MTAPYLPQAKTAIERAAQRVSYLSETDLIVIERILAEVSHQTSVPVDGTHGIMGHSRAQHVVYARYLVIYAIREAIGLSYPKIAHLFGYREHTAVLHGYNKTKKILAARGYGAARMLDLIGRAACSEIYTDPRAIGPWQVVLGSPSAELEADA